MGFDGMDKGETLMMEQALVGTMVTADGRHR